MAAQPASVLTLAGVNPAMIPLVVAAAILGARTALAPVLNGPGNDLASALSQTAVATLAGFAVVLGLRNAVGEHRHYGLRVLAGILIVLVLSIAESVEEVVSTDEWLLLGMFALAVAMTVYQLTPLVIRGVAEPVLVAASLDMVIFFASGLAVVGSIADWRGIQVSDATIAVVSCLIAMLAWTATSATVLFVRGVRISAGGPFLLLAGLSLVAIAGASWVAGTDTVALAQLGPTDFVFSVGVVMIARGWLTWSVDSTERRTAWLMETGRDLVSTSAIMVAIIVVVLGPASGSPSRIGIVGEAALLIGVVTAGIRQVAIKEYERRSRIAEAHTSARLVTEISDRGRVSRALEGVEPGDSVRLTAERICERLLVLPCADFVIVTSLEASGAGLPLAAAGVLTYGLVGVPLDGGQAERLRSKAAEGAWSEPADVWLEPWLPFDFLQAAPRCLQAPLVWDDHLVGILTIGSRDVGDPENAQRHEATTREAAVLVAALVGPALAAEAALHRRRERIEQIITENAFHPVFQPIVELATERIVGFEALTRFDEGGRPDLWFHEASAAGRGIELESATLTAAVREACLLPPECYISLNVSAELASSVEVLGRLLTRVPRQLLLEITEHVPVEDYERMMANLYALDIKIRLAVDDAGAGYSGLQHILAIRPHVVKLDAALVRFVDVDVARQAIVGAMVSFAARTGCTIVAEGAETASEVAMLRSLGVTLTQGYFYGRPRPAAEWRVELAARGSASACPVPTAAAVPVPAGVPAAAVPPVPAATAKRRPPARRPSEAIQTPSC